MIQKIEFDNRKTELSLYLPEGVQPERRALDEVRTLTGLEETVERLKQCGGFFEDPDSKIVRMIFTPDFHKDERDPERGYVQTGAYRNPGDVW